MKHHNLKLFKKYFQHMVDCEMLGQVRYNDRDYQVGDTITFHEGQQELSGYEYTGRTISGMISYIDDFGCQYGHLNLSISNVGLLYIVDIPQILLEQA